jgi:SET domain-containing protein
LDKKAIIYQTVQDVKKGEELCISYGQRLTFEDADMKECDSEDEGEMLGRLTLGGGEDDGDNGF